MRYFVVIRERGPAWKHELEMDEQDGWAEHAAFMNGLVNDDFVVLGGPLGEGEKVLLIVDAQDEETIHARLAADPWTPMSLLRIAGIEPWDVLLGG